ncbi:hypothetical protein ACFO1B_07035 [Dactylosporangium siamense]|uniref:Uncharacterized protein n=1 Tax=Dactylosporangium siamense TaxID=685454 RepID=A0A919PGI0_9ACTN|nr:hypothetical protein [Dactylosporangium siamense]GIG43514.1 hypothetical protein Dsi01nite_015550 [Dactylosporangium siamense]
MEQSSPVIPLRPLTFGELLDAAVQLLRINARLLLIVAFVLALCEQAVLFPLRSAAGVDGTTDVFSSDDGGLWWLVFCCGLTTEGIVLALLGGLTGAAAGPALLGAPVPARDLLRQWGRRAPALIVLAVAVGLILLPSAIVALPWFYFFGAIGLAAPALAVDRVGPGAALARSFNLAPVGLRGVAIRLGSYGGWAAIRVAIGWGTGALLATVLPSDALLSQVTTVAVWILANTVVYAALACLDAVLYLECRMRIEGLDVAVGRSRRLGRPVDLAQAAVLGAVKR